MDPVAISAPPAFAAGTVLWRHGAAMYVTAVAKRSFRLEANGDAAPAPPSPLLDVEVDQGGGRVSPDDIAPCVAQASAWATGHVRGRAPGQLLVVTLRVRRGDQVLLEKRASVQTDARGYGTLSAFGPLSRRWPARARHLQGAPPSVVQGRVIVVPETFDWSYFHVAGSDQQLAWLAPGDVVTLEIAGVSAITLRLPPDLPEAIVHEAGRPLRAVPLHPDAVGFDVDQGRVHLVYRAREELLGDPRQARLEVMEAVEVGDGAVAELEVDDLLVDGVAAAPVAPEGLAQTAPTLDGTPAGTQAASSDEVAALRAKFALPFRDGPRAYEPPRAPPEMAAQSGATAAFDEASVAALRAQFALPFRGAAAPAPAPPPPAWSSGPASPWGSAPPSDRGPFSPPSASFAPASSPSSQVSSPASSARPAPLFAAPSAPEGQTAAVSPDEIAALRAAFSTPFEKPSAKLARARPSPLATASPPAAAPAPERSGETAAIDPSEVEKLRALVRAAPFKAAASPAPPASNASAGASFLDAVGDDDDD